jgi:YesN/AraC family two-component response regulator
MVVVDNMIRVTITALSYCVNREVKSFGNGSIAWDYISDGGEAEIVISDVDIPGMNGFELWEK